MVCLGALTVDVRVFALEDRHDLLRKKRVFFEAREVVYWSLEYFQAGASIMIIFM